MATWQYIGVSTVVDVVTNNITLVEPTGVRQGDLLVACIAFRSAAATGFTLPAGWTVVDEEVNNNVLTTTSGLGSAHMAYIIRGAAAPADLTWTRASGANVALGRIVAYRNSAQSATRDTSSSNTTAINTTAVSLAGVTTGTAGCLLVVMIGGGADTTFSAFNATTPSGSSGVNAVQLPDPITTWQERQDSLTTNGADTTLAIADAVKTTAGATGNITCTAAAGAGHALICGAFKILDTSANTNFPLKFGSYQFSNTASDLTGVGQNKTLVTTGATNGTWSGQSIASSDHAYASYFTAAGVPDTNGQANVSTNVLLYVTTSNANFQYGAALVRVNSSGTVQAVGPETVVADSGAGVYPFINCQGTSLGTFASGDRLEVRLCLHNKSTNTAQSATIQLGQQATDDTFYSQIRAGFANTTMKFGYGERGITGDLTGSDLIFTKNNIDVAAVDYACCGATVRQLNTVAGKFHCEFTIGTVTSGPEVTNVGLYTQSAAIYNIATVPSGYFLGLDISSMGMFDDGVVYLNNAVIGLTGPSFQAADIVALEYDASGSLVYFNRRRAGANAGWTAGYDVSSMGGNYLGPAVTVFSNTDAVTINLDGPFSIAPQTTAYTKWDGSPIIVPGSYFSDLSSESAPVIVRNIIAVPYR